MKIASNELENWPEGPATYGEAGIVMRQKAVHPLCEKH